MAGKVPIEDYLFKVQEGKVYVEFGMAESRVFADGSGGMKGVELYETHQKGGYCKPVAYNKENMERLRAGEQILIEISEKGRQYLKSLRRT